METFFVGVTNDVVAWPWPRYEIYIIKMSPLHEEVRNVLLRGF